MKLLFDENLSHLLAKTLSDIYPDSLHLRDCGLRGVPDSEVWEFAAAKGFSIVSKDSDFSQRSSLLGSPPKVILLRIGNCSTLRAEFLLRDAYPRIQSFLDASEGSCLVLTVSS